MRNQFAKSIYERALKDKKIHVLVADISPAGKMEEFQKKFPKRFLNVGVAEQTMIGMCAGLAMKGMKPFAYTISTFALYRPFEMIRVDLCYQNLPVCVVGMGAGTIYANLGGTHLTQEDISVARSIPNIDILAPCDPYELKKSVNYFCTKSKKPMYLRIGKAGEKTFKFKESEKWQFGKIRQLVNGKDLCILSFGPIISKVFSIKSKLLNNDISSEIYSCHTLKPFDSERLKKIFKKFKTILILEDHSAIGGLAQIVKTLAFEKGYNGKIISYSLKDKFIHCYSNQNDLLDKHGINENNIVSKIKKIINQK
jgi:transketolase